MFSNLFYPRVFLCQIIDKEFVVLTSKYYLLAGYTNSSPKQSLTCWHNLRNYKSAHHPLCTLPVKIENNLAVFKLNQ